MSTGLSIAFKTPATWSMANNNKDSEVRALPIVLNQYDWSSCVVTEQAALGLLKTISPQPQLYRRFMLFFWIHTACAPHTIHTMHLMALRYLQSAESHKTLEAAVLCRLVGSTLQCKLKNVKSSVYSRFYTVNISWMDGRKSSGNGSAKEATRTKVNFLLKKGAGPLLPK